MNITLMKAFNSFNVLHKIKIQNLGFKIDYWCMKNMKELADNYNFFTKTQSELVDKYCFKNKNGEYGVLVNDTTYQYNIKEGYDAHDFINELNELCSIECEISPYLISPDDFFSSEIKIDGNDIFDIDYLLK